MLHRRSDYHQDTLREPATSSQPQAPSFGKQQRPEKTDLAIALWWAMTNLWSSRCLPLLPPAPPHTPWFLSHRGFSIPIAACFSSGTILLFFPPTNVSYNMFHADLNRISSSAEIVALRWCVSLFYLSDEVLNRQISHFPFFYFL